MDIDYITLGELIDTIADETNATCETVRALLASADLERVRPMRIAFDTGGGEIIRSSQDTRYDDAIRRIVAPISDLDGAASEDLHYLAGLDVSWSAAPVVEHMRGRDQASLLPDALREQGAAVNTQPATDTTRSAGLRTTDDLRRWLGYKRDADVLRFLRENGIEYRLGVGGRPVTTDAAIDAAMSGGDSYGSHDGTVSGFVFGA